MFGENPIRSAEMDPRFLAIEEVFYTLQGEGPYSGMPALFIRLSGCNLACWFCDTQFEKMANQARPVGFHLANILAAFTPKQREFVVITGGEPLRQDPAALVTQLINTGTQLAQIETAGTLAPSDAMLRHIEQDNVVLVCSPKTPKIHPAIVQYCQHWKYVVRANELDPFDGLPDRGTQTATKGQLSRLYRPTPGNHNTIWLSPCDEYEFIESSATPVTSSKASQLNMQAAVQSCLKHGYRLSLQTHKIVGLA